MSRLRVACVGAGGIAERHLGALARMDDVELVGVSGRTPARAVELAARFGGRGFSSAEEMLDQARPDAVFVCVTPAAHGPIERALIERRTPFLVEKPLATDWDTAAAIAAEIEAAGLVAAVGYQWRYAPAVERAREILGDRKVALAQGYWLTRTPAPAWWSRQEESGGQMVEQTTHMFDLARLFLGEASAVYAATARVPRQSHPESDIDEVSVATLRFASGAVASFASTCILAASHKVGLHLYAENMAIEIGAASVVVDTGDERRELRPAGDPTFAADRDFLDAVRAGDGSRLRSSYADALRTHRLTTLARDAARAGQALPVEA